VPALFAVEPTTPPDRRTVTLFYEAPERFSAVALESMQQELARLLEPSALRFEWLELAQAPETEAPQGRLSGPLGRPARESLFASAAPWAAWLRTSYITCSPGRCATAAPVSPAMRSRPPA
jgi:hypothetical protein